jgi:tRNA nucleotidyltransferase (CCA-adding enzyme)
MKVYLVGGAVRDKLLGLDSRDKDYLVVGSSVDEMKRQGFLSVGESFPIFLHPITKDEYTLGESLQDDLQRRDLTINAMAMDEDGNLIDLFSGLPDLKHKLLKHVKRENFYTDPLRVLRVARFQAQFPDFSIAVETFDLMRETVQLPGFAKIAPERVVKELERVFETNAPSVFFATLEATKALATHFPELVDKKFAELDRVTLKYKNPVMQFAALVSSLSLDNLENLGKRLLLQNSWLEAGRARILFQGLVPNWTPGSILEFFYHIDAFRKPGLVDLLSQMDLEKSKELGLCFEKVKEVSIRNIASAASGKAIGEALRLERLKRLG